MRKRSLPRISRWNRLSIGAMHQAHCWQSRACSERCRPGRDWHSWHVQGASTFQKWTERLGLPRQAAAAADPPVRQGVALHDLGFAADLTERVPMPNGGHAKHAVALHAAPHHEPVARLKDVQRHAFTCATHWVEGLGAGREPAELGRWTGSQASQPV